MCAFNMAQLTPHSLLQTFLIFESLDDAPPDIFEAGRLFEAVDFASL